MEGKPYGHGPTKKLEASAITLDADHEHSGQTRIGFGRYQRYA